MKELKKAMSEMRKAMQMAEVALSSYGYEDEEEGEDLGDGDKNESYPDSGDGAKPMDEMKEYKKKMLVQKMKKSMKV